MARSDTPRADTAARALARAQKRYRHAVTMLEAAESESARKRHARQAHNASRGMAEARRAFESAAFSGA